MWKWEVWSENIEPNHTLWHISVHLQLTTYINVIMFLTKWSFYLHIFLNCTWGLTYSIDVIFKQNTYKHISCFYYKDLLIFPSKIGLITPFPSVWVSPPTTTTTKKGLPNIPLVQINKHTSLVLMSKQWHCPYENIFSGSKTSSAPAGGCKQQSSKDTNLPIKAEPGNNTEAPASTIPPVLQRFRKSVYLVQLSKSGKYASGKKVAQNTSEYCNVVSNILQFNNLA